MTNVSEKDLIDVVSYLTDKPNDDCAEIVKTVFDVMFDYITRGENINIDGFGNFEIFELPFSGYNYTNFTPCKRLFAEMNGASHDI